MTMKLYQFYLLGILILPDSTGSSACPSLNTEISELTEIGTVVFTFLTDAASVSLEAQEGSSQDGFLELQLTAPNHYNIILTRGVNLNELNPRPPPVVDTNEKLDCDYKPSLSTEYQQLVSSLQYTLKCTVTFSYTTVQVQSGVRVAIRDVNDNAPHFLCAPYEKTISELTPVSTTIFTLKGLAADLDLYGGIAGYDLISGGEGAFALTGAASQGYIAVNGTLDYDSGPREYALNISTVDVGDPPLTNWSILHITISDGDDQNPVFEYGIYHLSLEEQREDLVGSYVDTDPPVNAYDLDYGINATIGYKIVAGHTHMGVTYFDINEENGQIKVLGILDILLISQFVIQIKCYQLDKPNTRFTFATLIVDVVDINNHPPYLTQSAYHVALAEHSPLGYPVLTIIGYDNDEGSNADLSYYVIDPGGALTMDSVTGVLSVGNPAKLDREVHDIYTVQVYAEEMSTEEHYSSDLVTVTVEILDINDNSPVFSLPHYTFLVNDTVPLGTLVGKVSAVDPDLTGSGLVHYHIVYYSDGANTSFSLDEESGEISIRNFLTSKMNILFYSLYIQAVDQPLDSSQARSGFTTVDISVISVNDNPPQIEHTVYNIILNESLSVGSVVQIIKAVDQDGDSVSFSLEGEQAIMQNFRIDPQSGLMTLQQSLDREMRDNMVLWVNATDRTHISRSLINITVSDTNDNSPVFWTSNMTFTIEEGLPAFTEIGLILVTDSDAGLNGEVQVQLLGNWITQYISLDPSEAMLRTVTALDREMMPRLQFMVEAFDLGQPSRSSVAMVTVLVTDINDNAPVIMKEGDIHVTVPEAAMPGFIYQIQSVDPDYEVNSLTEYRIIEGDHNIFEIDPTSGEIGTVVTLDVDQSLMTRHRLVVMAYNTVPYDVGDVVNDTASVYVTVEDKNDHLPVFTKQFYHFVVSEDSSVWTLVGRVVARDADYSSTNRQIRYWKGPMLDGAESPFVVDEFTGEIRLLRKLDTDTPSGEQNHTIIIYASDMKPIWNVTTAENVSVTVNIMVMDTNDNKPHFEKDHYEVTIPEDINLGSKVLTLKAVDHDLGENGLVSYDLLTSGTPFIIEEDTIILHGELDADLGPDKYTLRIIALDHGQPILTGAATVDLFITNVNDHWPQFHKTEYRFTISEGQPVGMLVGVVVVTDRDQDVVNFTVEEEYKDMFYVTLHGEVRTLVLLDFEQTATFTFEVMATEVNTKQGQMITEPHRSVASVTVLVTDVNDNAPVFGQDTYHTIIKEGGDTSNLIQLQATDADTGLFGLITYSLLDGPDSSRFAVDNVDGIITASDGATIHYDVQSIFTLTIQARDGGVPPRRSVAVVTIAVQDINNNPPEFPQSRYDVKLQENLPADSFILQVTAKDKDTRDELIYDVTKAADNGGLFSIHAQSGVITSLAPLDREYQTLYILNISATDGVHTTFCQVRIEVTDMNDNSPVFPTDRYERYISADTKVGLSVLQVKATDEDDEINGFVTHWLIGGQGKFHLDPFSGVMILTASLMDKGTQEIYQMTVYAKDHGEQPKLTNTSVVLKVSRSNLHNPEFIEYMYDVEVPENIEPMTPVLKVNVSDLDEGAAGEIAMTLTGTRLMPFEMDSGGLLYVVRELDHEVSPYYSLEVIAMDGGSDPKSAMNVVRVTVTDVNDNSPYFLHHLSHIHLPGHSSTPQLITQVVAMDKDSDLNDNNVISYSITSGNEFFTIDTESGELQSLPTIFPGTHTVELQASDGGTPPLTNTTSLQITVLDGSMVPQYPFFTQKVYTVYFNESWRTPRPLVQVQAGFSAEFHSYTLQYAILKGNERDQFHIDASSGLIQVLETLDREQTPQLTLVVQAYRTDNMVYQTQALVHVTVQDSNDEIPHFPFLLYTATVQEDEAVGTEVISLSADDRDSSGELQYYLLSYLEDHEDSFYLAETQGVATIALAHQLDKETMPDYIDLFIGVSDGPNAGSPALVQLKILDVNDNDPRFDSHSYNISIFENLGPCGEIGQILATDPDVSDHGRLIYSLLEDTSGLFSVSSSTGVVSLSCLVEGLDRETSSEHRLVLKVEDSDFRQDMTEVIITILDVNDNYPQFSGQPYEFFLEEGEASRDFVMEFSVFDLDHGDNSQMAFTLESNFAGYFGIRYVEQGPDGIAVVSLEVLQEIDRELPGLEMMNDTAQMMFTLKSTDRGQPPLSSSAMITLNILDINDNTPEFSQDVYQLTLSEGTPLNTPVLTVRAIDSDTQQEGALFYEMSGAEDILSIGSGTGIITVSGSLDAGLTPQLSSTLTVSDGLHSSMAVLQVTILDTNNHAPVFTQPVYYFSVNENDHEFTLTNGASSQGDEQLTNVVGVVQATDLDLGDNGKIIYNITSRNARGLFVILEENTGNVTVIGRLDRETLDHYTLLVTATDLGQPGHMSTCEVEIEVLDVNDNSPKFEYVEYNGHVAERSLQGATVFMHPEIRATDKDIGQNSQIRFELTGSGSEYFSIDQQLGLIAVSQLGSGNLDRETKNVYYLQVVASDRNGDIFSLSGSAALTIHIDDVNDNIPAFEHAVYNLTVNEASSSGIVIGAFRASDLDLSPNNRLQYSIISGAHGKFWIDRITGDLYVTGGLDREKQDFYSLNISVTDTGVNPSPLESFSVVLVTVDDYNDNAPVFIDGPHQVFTLTEETLAGSFVGIVSAADLDTGFNGEIVYSMDDEVPFTMNSTTGAFFTTEILDREVLSEYIFTVIGKDRGYPSMTAESQITVILLDINDNAPEFSRTEYWANILEGSHVGSVVMLPTARDIDSDENSELTFTLSSGNPSEYFKINPENGLVQISQHIDYSELQTLGIIGDDHVMTFAIKAEDNGIPSKSSVATVQVSIDEVVSSRAPVFTNSTYHVTIPERNRAGVSVLRVEAHSDDINAHLSYAVLGTEFFALRDSNQGELITTSLPLDFEVNHEMLFTVQVQDNLTPPGTAFALISVSIEDVNDNSPLFDQLHYTFHVGEGDYTQPIPLGKVKATDMDSGNNGVVSYSIIQDFPLASFYVDPESGELFVEGLLDREDRESYRLFVQARDYGEEVKMTTIPVTVYIQDFNDNVPWLGNVQFNVTVHRSAAVGEELMAVKAEDDDKGFNGTVFYDLMYNKKALPFYIQNRDGWGILKLSSSLAYETASVYNLTILAYDLGTPSLSSFTSVKVTVLHDLDLVPEFHRDIYERRIPAGLMVNSTVFVANAGHGDFLYRILGGNDEDFFSLHPTTGALFLIRPLPPSQSSQFELLILARDKSSPPNTDRTKIVIISEPMGSGPVFLDRLVHITIPENQPVPVNVIDLDTLDEISAIEVIYTWADNPYPGLFLLDHATGLITNIKSLDREHTPKYKLKVQCERVHSQTANRKKRKTDGAVAEVIISVGDVNDNAPVFERDPIILGLSWDSAYNSPLGTITANDKDAGNNSAIIYSIIEGHDKDRFRIDPVEGHLYSRVKVDSLKYVEDLVFTFDVKATDLWGKGLSAKTTVQLFLLKDNQKVMLVAGVPPDILQENLPIILRNLSDILGWELRAEKIEPHWSDDGDEIVDFTRSDLYLYAVDHTTGRIISSEEVVKEVEKHSEEIEDLFLEFGIETIGPVYGETIMSGIGATEGALIALGGMVVAGSVIGIICVCMTWKQNKKRRKTGGLHLFGNGKPYPSHNGLPNPAFHGSVNDIYTSPVDLDNVHVYDSTFKPMETQRLSIYLPEEGQSSGLSTAVSSSYGGSGETALIAERQSGQDRHVGDTSEFDESRTTPLRDRGNRTVVVNERMRKDSSSGSSGYASHENGVTNETSKPVNYFFEEALEGKSSQQKPTHTEVISDYGDSENKNKNDPEDGLIQPKKDLSGNETGNYISIPGATEIFKDETRPMSTKVALDEKKNEVMISENYSENRNEVLRHQAALDVLNKTIRDSFLQKSGLSACGLPSVPPLATVFPYTSSKSSIRGPESGKVSAQLHDGSQSFPRVHYDKNVTLTSQTLPFTGTRKKIAGKISPINLNGCHPLKPSDLINASNPKSHKSLRFVKVSPLVNPIKSCLGIEDESNANQGSSLPKVSQSISDCFASKSTCDFLPKKRTWPGHGKMLSFKDCLGSKRAKHDFLSDKETCDGFIGLGGIFNKCLPYEESETKF